MFKKKIVKNKQLLFLLIFYTICNICLYTNNFYINFFKPSFWLFIIIIFYYQDFNMSKKKGINITFIISIIFLILYLFSGFIFGFSKNFSNYSLINTFTNVLKVILSICGIEIIRYKLLRGNKNNLSFIVLITAIIILSEIDFKTLFLSHNIIFFHYVASTIMPIIVENILFTYLSLNSHYDIPIIIKTFSEVPKIILPIMPYSNWFIEGSFAIIKVLIIYYLFKYFIFDKKAHHFTNLGITLYPLTIITSTLLVSFMLGLFSYKPIAILSNSMNPTFERGDVVIYKKEENIVPGNIIVFQYQNQIIVHRVVSINEYYVTKGDANNSVDYIKVKREDIKGVYQFSLKYLGYPSIWLNEFFKEEDSSAKKK